MDQYIRELQRAALRDPDDPQVVARLAAAYTLLGRVALVYKGPNPVPRSYPRTPRGGEPRGGKKLGVRRHQTMCSRSADSLDRSIERRNRTAARHACEEGLLEYLEDSQGGR